MKPTTVRIEERTKLQAEKILKSLGMNTSQAINMFLKQVVLRKGIPFEINIPNDETLASFDENLSQARRYKDADELLSSLVD